VGEVRARPQAAHAGDVLWEAEVVIGEVAYDLAARLA
jgi:hypothetical protein